MSAPTALLDAARAVVDRWDTASWKDVPATANFINALRDAIATHAQSADGRRSAVGAAMSNPCLILEWTEADTWPMLLLSGNVRRIPENRKPTMLQPDRKTAEAESKRLAALHPGRMFAVFEAAVVGTTVEVPSHITLSGKVWDTRKVPTLLTIDDSEIPF